MHAMNVGPYTIHILLKSAGKVDSKEENSQHSNGFKAVFFVTTNLCVYFHTTKLYMMLLFNS